MLFSNCPKKIERNNVYIKIDINDNGTNFTANKGFDEILFKILSNLLAIAKLLNYTDKQLHDFCIDKMNKTLEMISK